MTDSQTQVHQPVTPALDEVSDAPAASVGADPAVEHAIKGRRRAPGADPEVRSFGTARTCSADGCSTTLSRYNPDVFCSVHRGWDRQVVTRRRRAGVVATGLTEAGMADGDQRERAG